MKPNVISRSPRIPPDGGPVIGVSKFVIVAMTASLLTGGALVALTSGAGPLGGSDYGLDTDGDGAFDWLVVKMDLRVDETNYYNVWATLGTGTPYGRACGGYGVPMPLRENGTLPPNGSPWGVEEDPVYPISWATVREFLEAGEYEIALAFKGTDLGFADVDGPYLVQAQVYADGQWGDPYMRGSPLPGPAGGGWSWEYTTGAYDADAFEEPRWAIRFTGTASDYGLDLDGDGLFDYLVLEADVQANLAGPYWYDASLWSKEASRPDFWGWGAWTSGQVELAEGLQTIQARFNGGEIWSSGLSGAFDFTFNVYYGGGWFGGGIREGEPYPPGPFESEFDLYGDNLCGATAEYEHDQWEELVEPAKYTGVFSDEGEDLDGDGLYESLVVRAEVDVTEANAFDWSGQLMSGEGTAWITADYQQVYLEVGVQTLTLRFSGPDIRRSGIDGPYRVDMNLVVAMRDPATTYTTSAYLHTDFEEDGTNARGAIWIANASADGTEIRVTVERGLDPIDVVMEGVVSVDAYAADGTAVFAAKGQVFLPSGGSTQAFAFAWSPDPGVYVVRVVLDSQWGQDAVEFVVEI